MRTGGARTTSGRRRRSVIVAVQAVEHGGPAVGAVLAQLAHVDARTGAVGVSVDDEIDHRVQDHELEELQVGDPLLDVATEVAGADDLPRAAGQLDHHRRGRQEQVVELAERAPAHDVRVGILQTTDRDVIVRLLIELAHPLPPPSPCCTSSSGDATAEGERAPSGSAQPAASGSGKPPACSIAARSGAALRIDLSRHGGDGAVAHRVGDRRSGCRVLHRPGPSAHAVLLHDPLAFDLVAVGRRRSPGWHARRRSRSADRTRDQLLARHEAVVLGRWNVTRSTFSAKTRRAPPLAARLSPPAVASRSIARPSRPPWSASSAGVPAPHAIAGSSLRSGSSAMSISSGYTGSAGRRYPERRWKYWTRSSSTT